MSFLTAIFYDFLTMFFKIFISSKIVVLSQILIIKKAPPPSLKIQNLFCDSSIMCILYLVLGTSTRSRSRPEFSGGSRPKTGRDPEKKSGRDPKIKSGRDRPRAATQKENPVATEICGRGPVGIFFLFIILTGKSFILIDPIDRLD
jgi:hypothetical protein